MRSENGSSLAGIDVSRETYDRLKEFESLLLQWTKKINLVSRQSLTELWERHFEDSAQLFRFKPPDAKTWVDLGSGGGFPAIVISIIAAEHAPELKMTMVESDLRKAAFLRTAIRRLGINAEVVSQRIENIEPLAADVVSARALAPLDLLLSYAAPHLSDTGIALFLKGEKARDEVESARRTWHFELDLFPSLTDKKSTILKIGELSRV